MNEHQDLQAELAHDGLIDDPGAAELMRLRPSASNLTSHGVVYEAGRAVGREEGLRAAQMPRWRPRLALAASWLLAIGLGVGWLTSGGGGDAPGQAAVVVQHDGETAVEGVPPMAPRLEPRKASFETERVPPWREGDLDRAWVEPPRSWWVLVVRSAVGLAPVREVGPYPSRLAGVDSLAWPGALTPRRSLAGAGLDAWGLPERSAGSRGSAERSARSLLAPRDALDLELEGLEGWPGARRRSPAPAEPEASPRWWEVWIG
ncbi:MAG: hypothetical protein AAF288_04615 [Planctomycetota bacterium]